MRYSSVFFIFLSYLLTPKFCVDCVHYIPDPKYKEYGKCKMFPIVSSNSKFLVTGEKQDDFVEYRYCVTARDLDHMCGTRGKKYVPLLHDLSPEIKV
jgi:hypothetical protein